MTKIKSVLIVGGVITVFRINLILAYIDKVFSERCLQYFTNEKFMYF